MIPTSSCSPRTNRLTAMKLTLWAWASECAFLYASYYAFSIPSYLVHVYSAFFSHAYNHTCIRTQTSFAKHESGRSLLRVKNYSQKNKCTRDMHETRKRPQGTTTRAYSLSVSHSLARPCVPAVEIDYFVRSLYNTVLETDWSICTQDVPWP